MSQKKINIPFSGITRNTDDGTCADGECMELINARIKNGSVEPVGRPITMKSFDEEYTKGFYHSLAKKYLFIKKEDATLVFYDEKFDNKWLLPSVITGVVDVQFIGYILCVTATDGVHYFIHKTNQYYYIGQKPNYSFSICAVGEEENPYNLGSEYLDYGVPFDKDTFIIKPDFVNTFLDVFNSQKNKKLSSYDDKNKRISDPVCVRAALKMYNGSYISHSPIYIAFPTREVFSNSRITGIGRNHGTVEIMQRVNSYNIKYEIEFQETEEWKDIITSIDIFVSKPFSLIDIDSLKENGIQLDMNPYGNVILSTLNQEKMGEKIMQAASLMYLSKSVKINSEKKTDSGLLENADSSNEKLTDDLYTWNKLYGDATFVYNSRMHIGGVKSILFNGYSSNFQQFGGQKQVEKIVYNGIEVENKLASVKIYIFINTDSGDKTVMLKESIQNPVGPLFCYPDFRATKAIFFTELDTAEGSKEYRKSVFALTKSSVSNVAYYLGWDIEKNCISPIDLKKGNTISEYDFNNPDIIVNNIEHSPNKLKVSELNNPFYFPPQTTYTPSSGNILSLASNTAAISQGQFGQFPLIVFCSDGIYAMSVGTDVVYGSSSPLSRDVCSNPQSVIPIDNAIIFPSEQGLMLLQGSTVKNLSEAINGYLPSSIESSPVIGKILSIPKLINATSATRFDDYIKKCHIGYNYQERELIISNTEYPYSYVYSLAYAQWYKTSYSVKSFVNKYPDILALTTLNNEICNLQNNYRTVSDIAIVSRPIKLGTLTHKRILQSALRGIVKRSISDLYLKGDPILLRGDALLLFKDVGFYVLGSNDAEHFELISGTESIKDIRDIVGKMTKSKAYKYFVFAFVGGVRTDISINYIELIADESFNNRLR